MEIPQKFKTITTMQSRKSTWEYVPKRIEGGVLKNYLNYLYNVHSNIIHIEATQVPMNE